MTRTLLVSFREGFSITCVLRGSLCYEAVFRSSLYGSFENRHFVPRFPNKGGTVSSRSASPRRSPDVDFLNMFLSYTSYQQPCPKPGPLKVRACSRPIVPASWMIGVSACTAWFFEAGFFFPHSVLGIARLAPSPQRFFWTR